MRRLNSIYSCDRGCLARVILAAWLAASWGVPHFSYAQVRLTGSVVSEETGLPLPAAHVRVRDTSTGTITNSQGDFELIVDRLPVRLEVRYIGYATALIDATPNGPREFSIALKRAIVELGEVVVSGVDRAEQIMREVIRRKQTLRDTLSSSAASIYSRTTLSRDGDIQLIRETVWDRYQRPPSGTRNVIRSLRETSELYNVFGITPGNDVPNFYDDVIAIAGLSFVGPTHPNAEATYEFTLGPTRMIDSLVAQDIYVAPKSDVRPAFIGTIAVVDSLYTLAAVDLRPARSIVYPDGFESWSVSYQQHFGPVSGDVWFPNDLVAEGRIVRTTRDEQYLSAYLTQYARINDYQLSRRVPDAPFESEAVLQIDSASVFEDYLFMRGFNIIPLTAREDDAFYRLRADPNRLASVFREQRTYDVLSVIRPRTYRRDGPQFVWPMISGYIPSFKYNRVDGLHSAIGQSGSPTRNSHLQWMLGQSTAAGGIRYKLAYETGVGEHLRLGFDLNRNSRPVAASLIYSDAITSIPSLIGRGDYFDYYWGRRAAVSAGGRWDLARFDVTAYRDKDEPLVAGIGKSWPWGTTYRPNPAISDSTLIGAIATLRVGDSYQPYHTTSRGAVLTVERGIDRAFTRADVTADVSVQTFFRRTIRPNRLDVRMTAGLVAGNAPMQRLGGLDGTVAAFATPGVFRSVRDRFTPADHWASVHLDHDFGSVLFEKSGLRFLSATRTRLHGFMSAGTATITSRSEASAFYPARTTHLLEAGGSLSNIFGSGLRIDVGSRIDQRGWFVSFGL